MKLIILIMLFVNISRADALLDYMQGNWLEPIIKEEIENPEMLYDEVETSEAESYHWELGTPDNLPETIIIYSDEPSPCEL
jgi:hypothetical protein